MTQMFYVYILECADGTLYTGYTDDIRKRLAVHNAGKGAKYTRSRLPCRLAYAEECENKQDAMKREWFIKHKLTREKKLALIDQYGKHIGLRRPCIMEKNLAEFVTEKVNCDACTAGGAILDRKDELL